MIIATLPPPHLSRMKEIALNPNINLFRFNTGTVSPFNPKETLEKILQYVSPQDLIVDVKGRQLRIANWAVYPRGDITLNRNIKVDLPATIHFRNDDISSIVKVDGRKIYADPGTKDYVGAGQSVNIIGNNFEVLGNYLTEIDIEYIKAAKELGIYRYALSFFEKISDIDEILNIDFNAIIYAKIESLKGIEFINKHYHQYHYLTLMVARDDLFINLENKKDMFKVLKLIISKDSDAIVASKVLSSLEKGGNLFPSDLSDIYLLKEMGYKNFMFGDEMSYDAPSLRKAIYTLMTF